jgi:hypothetical protein
MKSRPPSKISSVLLDSKLLPIKSLPTLSRLPSSLHSSTWWPVFPLFFFLLLVYTIIAIYELKTLRPVLYECEYLLPFSSDHSAFPFTISKPRSKHTQLSLCLLLYMGVKLGLSYYS